MTTKRPSVYEIQLPSIGWVFLVSGPTARKAAYALRDQLVKDKTLAAAKDEDDEWGDRPGERFEVSQHRSPKEGEGVWSMVRENCLSGYMKASCVDFD